MNRSRIDKLERREKAKSGRWFTRTERDPFAPDGMPLYWPGRTRDDQRTQETGLTRAQIEDRYGDDAEIVVVMWGNDPPLPDARPDDPPPIRIQWPDDRVED